MAILGPGTPLKIGQEQIWRGNDKTNGFLMRNVDGRVPALKESFSRIDISAASLLSVPGVIPWGNALFRDIGAMNIGPGVVVADSTAAKQVFIGILEFNQGWQTGHPVQNWGVPTFARSDMIRAGYVGYKVTKQQSATAADYLAYLQGNKAMDVNSVRQTYEDWLTMLNSGSNDSLALCFERDTGFPVMVGFASNIAFVPPAGMVLGGYVVIYEPENEAVFINLKAGVGPVGR